MNTKFLTLCVGMAVLGASVGTAATADGTTAEDSLVTAGNQVPYVGVKAGTEKAKNYNGDGAQADGAIAIGEDAEAQTEYSIAIGKNVNAKGGKLEGYSTYYYPAIGIGMNVKVDGRDAIAIGRGVRAEGKDALALGRDSTADGEITLAIGYNASAKLAKKPNAGSDYKQATAVGPYAKALAPSANAFGSHSSVYEQFATALGDFASVYGVSGIAIGNQAKAGMNSTKAFASGIAIGEESKSEANQAIAIGKKAWSQATGSIALGENSETKNEYTETNALFSGVKNNDHEVGVVSVGRAKRGFTIKEVNRRITHIAGGVDDNDAVNVAQLKTISMQSDIRRIKRRARSPTSVTKPYWRGWRPWNKARAAVLRRAVLRPAAESTMSVSAVMRTRPMPITITTGQRVKAVSPSVERRTVNMTDRWQSVMRPSVTDMTATV